jgi:hypothetical protein
MKKFFEAIKANRGFYANVIFIFLNIFMAAFASDNDFVGICWGSFITIMIYINVSVAGVQQGIGQGLYALINTIQNTKEAQQ